MPTWQSIHYMFRQSLFIFAARFFYHADYSKAMKTLLVNCECVGVICCLYTNVGLSRTSEIFGVSEIVFSSRAVIEEKEFKSLSVTAEKWINVTEVSSVILLGTSLVTVLLNIL